MSRVQWFPLSVLLGATWVLAIPGDAAPQPEPQQRPIDRRALPERRPDERRPPPGPGAARSPRAGGDDGAARRRRLRRDRLGAGRRDGGDGAEPDRGGPGRRRHRLAGRRAGAGCLRAHGASRADGPPHPPHLHRTRCAAGADGAPGARRAARRRTSPRLHRLRNHLGARHLVVRNRAVHLERVGPGQPAPGPAGLRRRATDHRDRRPQRRGVVRPLGGSTERSSRRRGPTDSGKPSASSSSAAPI